MKIPKLKFKKKRTKKQKKIANSYETGERLVGKYQIDLPEKTYLAAMKWFKS
jgi:hypothetical protein